jgi:xylulokinase
MLLLGIDVGTSSVKVAIVDPDTRKTLASGQYPDSEAPILSKAAGWAEQSPEGWWEAVMAAIGRAHGTGAYDPGDIGAIGIAYQMHGLVLVDPDQRVLRDSIIWCDSRAVPYGEGAFRDIGGDRCLDRLLNSPGNFTAAKLAWVKEMEPRVYEKIGKVLLPGDFIAMKLTGEVTTSIPALSEGIFWDFKAEDLSEDIFNYFGFDKGVIPAIRPVFSSHGEVTAGAARVLGLRAGIPVTYKAGDQPNNALSLNVLEPGEVAATAGTSGVIYGVSDRLTYDPASRVNSFAHVNYAAGGIGYDGGSDFGSGDKGHPEDDKGHAVGSDFGGGGKGSAGKRRIGVLLCINGTGILNRWIKDLGGGRWNYTDLNEQAAGIGPGSEGLVILPFGNGAERILGNRLIGAHIHHIDLTQHTPAHIYRAGQEGIAFAFRYGLDIMRENGMSPSVIRAGRTNMFLSPVFTEAFVNATNVPVELYDCDGSVGAALGAGIGAGMYADAREAFAGKKPLQVVGPDKAGEYDVLYGRWKAALERELK